MTSRIGPLVLVLLGSALAWAILFAAIPSGRQNFPLDDDWAFARAAFSVADGKGIIHSNWASMPLWGQCLWARPFVRLLGETHVALRISTIVLSWLGLCAFYDLMLASGLTGPQAGFRSATLAFNPLFFLLEGTFMTDVPALSFSLVALALYNRAILQRSVVWLFPALLAATLAVCTRQNAVIVCAAAGMMLWRAPELRSRIVWLAGILLPIAIAGAVTYWLLRRPDVRPLKPALCPPHILVLAPYQFVHFAGLSSLPLLMLAFRPGSWKRFLILALLMLTAGGYWWGEQAHTPFNGLFPYQHNMLSPWGAFHGPAREPLFPGERPLLMGNGIRILLSALGCAAGAAWLEMLIVRHSIARRFGHLVWFSLFQVPIILLTPVFHDRYLLGLLPGALEVPESRATIPGPRWIAGVIAVAILGGCSVGLMHDWLAWNSVRWALGRQALDTGIKPYEIEGGMEWDGWWTDVPRYPHPMPAQGLALQSFHASFPQITGDYALSFSPLPDSAVVKQESYDVWLRGVSEKFYLLRYKPES